MLRTAVSLGPVLILAHALINPAQSATTDGNLSKRVLSQLSSGVIPAYNRGDPVGIIRAVAPLAAKLDEQQLLEVDAVLDKQGVPKLEDLLVHSRLLTVHQTRAGGIPQPKRHELVLIIPALQRKIHEVLSEKEGHPAFASQLPQPDNFAEYEELFWQIHVFTNRLENAARLADYGQTLSKRVLNLTDSTLSDEQQTVLNVDFAELMNELRLAQRMLVEATIELRAQRVSFAAKVIQNLEDFRKRLIAAHVSDLDGRLLSRFFTNSPAAFSRPALNDAGFAESVASQAKRINEAAGDLVRKSRLLFEGLHWWLRGRYGIGTDGFGLLKSVHALRSPPAQFGLYMPAVTPVPTDPFDGSSQQIPYIDRRHHYIWMYEYRRIVDGVSQLTAPVKSKTTTTKLKYFY